MISSKEKAVQEENKLFETIRKSSVQLAELFSFAGCIKSANVISKGLRENVREWCIRINLIRCNDAS